MSQRAVQGIRGQETQQIAGPPACPRVRGPRQTCTQAGQILEGGLIDKQVFLTQMECGVSTFPKGDQGQVCTWSFSAVNALTVVFQNPLSVPPPGQWSLPELETSRAVFNDFLLSVFNAGITSSTSSSLSTRSPTLYSANSAAVFEMFPQARGLRLLPVHISSFY